MANTTSAERKMSREEAAEYLRGIADEMESGRARVTVPVGNKAVGLSPPGTVGSEVAVTERSRRIRKDVEELELTFRWNPTRAVDEDDGGDEETGEADEERDDAGPVMSDETENGSRGEADGEASDGPEGEGREGTGTRE